MEIRQETESFIARRILEGLSEWFGIPESREAYIRESRDQLFFCAYREGEPVGFLCLKETGKDAAEIVTDMLKEL